MAYRYLNRETVVVITIGLNFLPDEQLRVLRQIEDGGIAQAQKKILSG
jgi:hypothetical protein